MDSCLYFILTLLLGYCVDELERMKEHPHLVVNINQLCCSPLVNVSADSQLYAFLARHLCSPW